MMIENDTRWDVAGLGWREDIAERHGGLSRKGDLVRGDGLRVPYDLHVNGSGGRHIIRIDHQSNGMSGTYATPEDALEAAASCLSRWHPIRECGWCGCFIMISANAEERYLEEHGRNGYLHPKCAIERKQLSEECE